jgi:hypothetical protein
LTGVAPSQIGAKPIFLASADQVAAVGLHLGGLGGEVRGAALVGRHRRRLHVHGGELLCEAVEHVLTVFVVLVHDAGGLGLLPLDHVLDRRPRAFDVGQQVVELQPLLRLGRVELVGELRRRQREELRDTGVEQDILRRQHGGRAHRADHGEDLVLLDHLLAGEHGLLRVVLRVLGDQPDLAAVDAALGIDFVDGELHAVQDGHTPHLDRTGEVLMGAENDLGRGDALVGDLGLRERRQGGEADRGTQQGRFQ